MKRADGAAAVGIADLTVIFLPNRFRSAGFQDTATSSPGASEGSPPYPPPAAGRTIVAAARVTSPFPRHSPTERLSRYDSHRSPEHRMIVIRRRNSGAELVRLDRDTLAGASLAGETMT